MPDYFSVSHISRKDLARIFGKIKISTDRSYQGSPCWEWLGAKAHGYANLRWAGKVRRAHRVLYAWIFGPIPHRGAGLEVDHLCRHIACVNPAHLELVTSRVNTLRSQNIAARYAARTHCNNGHEFNAENAYIALNGSRRCRICKNADACRRRRSSTEQAAKERERGKIAMRERRAKLRDNPEWRERQRQLKREAYARYKQKPEWVEKERARFRVLYHKQKAESSS